jgi:hypothetical protein
MIRHVVMWVFLEESGGRTREDNVLRAFELLRALPEAIPVIRRFDVVTDQLGGEKQAHLLLDADFDSWDDLETYQQHPAHLEVVAFFRAVETTRWAVDHEVL